SVAAATKRRQHEHVFQVCESGAICNHAGEADLLAVDIAAEADGVRDRFFYQGTCNAAGPVRFLRQKPVDHRHVELGRIGGNTQSWHAVSLAWSDRGVSLESARRRC